MHLASIFIALIMTFFAFGMIKLIRLRLHGINTAGRIIDKKINTNSDGDTYEIDYEFQAIDMQIYKSMIEDSSKRFYKKNEINSPVKIIYNSKNPTQSYLADKINWHLAFVSILFIVFLLVDLKYNNLINL